MKSIRSALAAAVLLVPCAIAFEAFGQGHQEEGHAKMVAAETKTQAQAAFASLKTLSGSWRGHMTIDPPAKEFDGRTVELTLRTTSMGNALMHEMKVSGRPDDPITMLYLDGGRLLLTHYCDAGNRPRMVGTASADGRRVEFHFLDVAGATDYGHMHHAAFTVIDANHHTEEWTFMEPGDKPVKVEFSLERVE
jgi:hypothetical protein